MKKTEDDELMKVAASSKLRQGKELPQKVNKLPYTAPMFKVNCICLEKCFAVSAKVQTSDLKYNEYQDETLTSNEDVELY